MQKPTLAPWRSRRDAATSERAALLPLGPHSVLSSAPLETCAPLHCPKPDKEVPVRLRKKPIRLGAGKLLDGRDFLLGRCIVAD